MVRWCSIVAFILLVAGCQHPDVIPPLSHNASTSLAGADGILVVGVSIKNREVRQVGQLSVNLGRKCFQDYGIIKFNRVTGFREGAQATRWCERCEASQMFGDESANACQGGINYELYKLPAGEYALAYLLYDMNALLFVKFESFRFSSQGGSYINRTLSPFAHLLPTSPTISLGAGEVVYAGDIVFDGATWSTGSTPAGAQALLSKVGLSDRMIVKQWRPFGRDIKGMGVGVQGGGNVSSQ